MPDSTSPQLHGGGGKEGVGGNDFKKTEVTMNIDRLVETLNQVGVCMWGGEGGWSICMCMFACGMSASVISGALLSPFSSFPT